MAKGFHPQTLRHYQMHLFIHSTNTYWVPAVCQTDSRDRNTAMSETEQSSALFGLLLVHWKRLTINSKQRNLEIKRARKKMEQNNLRESDSAGGAGLDTSDSAQVTPLKPRPD